MRKKKQTEPIEKYVQKEKWRVIPTQKEPKEELIDCNRKNDVGEWQRNEKEDDDGGC